MGNQAKVLKSDSLSLRSLDAPLEIIISIFYNLHGLFPIPHGHQYNLFDADSHATSQKQKVDATWLDIEYLAEQTNNDKNNF